MGPVSFVRWRVLAVRRSPSVVASCARSSETTQAEQDVGLVYVAWRSGRIFMRRAAAGRKWHGCVLSERVQLRSYSEQDVFLRLCLPVINEGFKILEGGKLMFLMFPI